MHSARKGSKFIVHISMHMLAAQKRVNLGIGYIVGLKLAQRAIQCVIRSQRSKEIIVHKIVQRQVGHVLLCIGKQAEVQTAIQIAFLPKWSVVNSIHNCVIQPFAAPNAFGYLHIALIGLLWRQNVGAQLGVAVSVGTAVDFYRVVSTLLRRNQCSSICAAVKHDWRHIQPRLHASLMIQSLSHGQVLFVAVTQLWNKLAQLVVKPYFPVIIKFHQSAQRSGSFRHRGQPKQRVLCDRHF